MSYSSKVLMGATCIFLVYFYSETILRQAALSIIDKDKLKVETILDKLPQGIRQNVRKKIEIGELQDAVMRARNDSERINAMTSLAMAVDDTAKKESLFAEILENYPAARESTSAYIYFFTKKDSIKPISIGEMHKFMNGAGDMEKVGLWNMGLQRMKELKATDEEQWEFLKPLINFKPPFRDYRYIYEYMYNLAIKLNNENTLKLLSAKEEECAALPSMMELETERMKKDGGKK